MGSGWRWCGRSCASIAARSVFTGRQGTARRSRSSYRSRYRPPRAKLSRRPHTQRHGGPTIDHLTTAWDGADHGARAETIAQIAKLVAALVVAEGEDQPGLVDAPFGVCLAQAGDIGHAYPVADADEDRDRVAAERPGLRPRLAANDEAYAHRPAGLILGLHFEASPFECRLCIGGAQSGHVRHHDRLRPQADRIGDGR